MGYRPRLDGLRAVAVLLVVASHVVGRLSALGEVGVGLFFVLSGFLITSLLEEERDETGRTSLRRFYARRALRLWPALLVVTAAFIGLHALGIFVAPMREVFVGAAIAVFYLTDIVGLVSPKSIAPPLTHTWSLGVEEQFYLLWPVTLGLIRRLRLTDLQMAGAVGGLMIPAAIARYVASLVSGPLLTPFPWTDALLAGCALAFLQRASRLFRPGRMLLVASWLPAMWIAFDRINGDDYLFGLSVLAIANAMLVANAFGPPIGREFLGSKVMVEVGRRSYGIYLWHFLAIEAVQAVVGNRGTAASLCGAAIGIGVAWLSYALIEVPFLRLKARFAVQLPSTTRS